MTKIMSGDDRAQVVLERLRLLLADMGWTEEDAVEEFTAQITERVNIGDKAVKQWFNRRIPFEHVFNIASVLGVSADWLAGEPGISKEEATRPGLYKRTVKREQKRQAELRTRARA